MNTSILAIGLASAIASFVVGLEVPGFGEKTAAATRGDAAALTQKGHVEKRQPLNRKSSCGAMGVVVEVTVIPSLIRAADGADTLNLSLNVNNHSNDALAVVYSIEIQDDEGRILVPPVPSSTPLMYGANSSQALDIQGVPPGLPDGYYVAHVLAAWRRDGIKEVGTTYLYFRALANRLSVITGDDWIANSKIMIGQPAAVFESEGK